VWVITDSTSEVPAVTLENSPAFAPSIPDEEAEEEKEERHMPPNSAVTVAFGHLIVSTHVDFLTRILSGTPAREQLSASADYKLVKEELEKFSDPGVCANTFARTEEEYRAVYELVRTGRMPESETMLGKALNALLGDSKSRTPRAQRIDGSKLPEYEMVRRYFGPAGATFATETDGWFVTGFTLSREAQ